MGLLGFITLVFVIAKVFGIGVVASWSWWLVLSPALFGMAVALIAFVMLFLCAFWANT